MGGVRTVAGNKAWSTDAIDPRVNVMITPVTLSSFIDRYYIRKLTVTASVNVIDIVQSENSLYGRNNV
jgi:hypothetical protein